MKIDFEKALAKGPKCYDQGVGDWWEKQSRNPAHQRAYVNIADYIAKTWRQQNKGFPQTIVDYACGNGDFLITLQKHFPKSRFVALDGSIKMLERLQKKLEVNGVLAEFRNDKNCFDWKNAQVHLVQTKLPNFSIPAGKADAVTFVFPNITYTPGDQKNYDKNGYKNRNDVAQAKILARLREMDPEDEVTSMDPEDLFESMMTDRVINRDGRHLLKKGGMFFKVDYANALREELSELTQLRSFFCEGALEKPIKETRSEIFFKYIGNHFHRSSVILDVYHQTKDPSDKTGGYFITGFKAV